MKVLISNTGSGRAGRIVEGKNWKAIDAKVLAHAFARVSYTNHGAHEREHTWYPVRAIANGETKCDFRPETKAKY
jgi:hypothetical protein